MCWSNAQPFACRRGVERRPRRHHWRRNRLHPTDAAVAPVDSPHIRHVTGRQERDAGGIPRHSPMVGGATSYTRHNFSVRSRAGGCVGSKGESVKIRPKEKAKRKSKSSPTKKKKKNLHMDR